MQLARLCGAIFALVFAASVALAQQGPELRISSEQHLGPINAVAVSPDGATVATVGDDKTLRLWNTADGSLIDVMRTPIGPGPDGILYDVAFNWSGTRLLAGGISFDDQKRNGLFVLRPGNGTMRGRLPIGGTLSRVVLGETSDGRRQVGIAVFGSDGTGAFEVRDDRLRNPVYKRLPAKPNWIEFLPNGDLLVALDSGELNVYRGEERISQYRLAEGAQPATARLSPDGAYVAVGYWNRRQVDVLRLDGMRVVASLVGTLGNAAGDETLHFNAVAWRPKDGSTGGGEIWAGGSHASPVEGITILRRWPDFAKPDLYHDAKVAEQSITSLQPTPGGDMVFAAADPVWGVVDAAMNTRIVKGRPGADFRAAWKTLFAVDEDAQRIAFRFDTNGRVGNMLFDVPAMALSPLKDSEIFDKGRDKPLRRGWRGAIVPEGLTNFENEAVPAYNGVRLELLPNELSRAADSVVGGAAGLPEGGFILAADRGIYVYDRTGKRTAALSTASAAFAVLSLPDGRVLAAHGDGTLRWYRPDGDTLTEEAALYVAAADKDEKPRQWLAWTSEGVFAHSPDGGQRLAGYHIGQGPKATARWVDFSQIYAEAYLPDTVRERLLGALPEPQEQGEVAAETLALRTPAVEILELCPVIDGQAGTCVPAEFATRGLGMAEAGGDDAGSYQNGVRELGAEVGSVRLKYRITGIDGLPSKIDVFVNETTTGAELSTRGLGLAEAAGDEPGLAGARDVFLQDGLNRIVLRVYDSAGAFGVSREVAVHRAATPGETARPVLHVVAIGADDYSGDLARLNFAEKDAATVAETIEKHESSTYRDTVVHRDLVGPGNVSRERLTAFFEELAEEVKPEDGVVIYLAGHGLQNEAGRYVFVPPSVQKLSELEEKGVDQDLLLSAVGRIRAQNKLLLIDTCHAAAFEPPRRAAGSMNNEAGFMVIAAAAPESEALDGYNDENGVFAYALREGLAGAAALASDSVEAVTLGIYIAQRVPKLAAEVQFRQNPVVQNPPVYRSFPLTEVPQ